MRSNETEPEAAGVWDEFARRWSRLGPPMSPAPEDAAFVLTAFRDGAFSGIAGFVTAAILGVTPEYADLAWPGQVRVLGFDRAMGMVRGVWPCRGRPDRFVTCADWTRLPTADRSIDFVAGDGCFTTLPFPDGYGAVAAEVRRVLRPRGRFVIRCFAAPEPRDAPQQVHRGLRERRYANFDEYRLRLLMAVEEDPSKGVRYRDVYEEWVRAVPDGEALADANGWPRECLQATETWRRNGEVRMTFPTLEQVREVLRDSFVEKACHVAGYSFGPRSPFLVLEPRS